MNPEVVAMLITAISSSCGMLFNGMLMYALLRKTPKQIRTYSILIFNFAITDFCACFLTVFLGQRVVPSEFCLMYVSNGPCKYFGPRVCYIFYSFMCHTYSHSVWSILLSFTYRHYVLFHEQPTNRKLMQVVLLVYLPSLFGFITFCFADNPVEEVRATFHERFPQYNIEGLTITGNLNIFYWPTLYTILNVTCPVTIVNFIIIVLRAKIIKHLSETNMISSNTKKMHSQLLKALTFQALLPLFYVIAAFSYFIGQLGIAHHPAIEYTAFISTSFVPVLSPVMSFVFIQPYRVFAQRVLALRQYTSSVDVSKYGEASVATIRSTKSTRA